MHEYVLNTTATDFWAAERVCNAKGGHLVGFDELDEQVAVEQCFIQQGFLLPKFHQFYWMGLASGVNGAVWPNFTWIDHVKSIYM